MRIDINKLYEFVNTGFRRRRMLGLAHAVKLRPDTRVLDVGGTPKLWALIPHHPKLTIQNLAPAVGMHSAVEVVGDGLRLPFRDKSFDLVFSNSVIEHVGSIGRQQAFASEIARVGVKFWVQTPNRWFPIEPHLLTPLVHFLPKELLRRVVRNSTLWGIVTRPDSKGVDDFVESTRLLDRREMRELFPTARIRRECVLGLTKSLVALGPGE